VRFSAHLNPIIPQCLIYLHSKCFKQQRAPSFWKFNTSLLGDDVYVTALKLNVPIHKEKYKDVHDLGQKWDLIKIDILKEKRKITTWKKTTSTRNSMTCWQKPRTILTTKVSYATLN